VIGRLPYELRLYIFKLVFLDASPGQTAFRIVNEGGKVSFKLTDDCCDLGRFEGPMSCLDANVLDKTTAAAAVEALYGSRYTVEHLKHLETFQRKQRHENWPANAKAKPF
jgi:hypothetical protein